MGTRLSLVVECSPTLIVGLPRLKRVYHCRQNYSILPYMQLCRKRVGTVPTSWFGVKEHERRQRVQKPESAVVKNGSGATYSVVTELQTNWHLSYMGSKAMYCHGFCCQNGAVVLGNDRQTDKVRKLCAHVWM